MRTLNSINVGFKSITTNFAGLLLFLVQCPVGIMAIIPLHLLKAVELYISLLRFIEKW